MVRSTHEVKGSQNAEFEIMIFLLTIIVSLIFGLYSNPTSTFTGLA